jgi:hypothetical protein
MKKVIILSFALVFIGIAGNAQTQNPQKKIVVNKMNKKNKILKAVQSQKAKADIKKASPDMRKEGE